MKSEEANKSSPYQLWQYRFKLALAQSEEDEGNLSGALDLLNEAASLYYRNIVPEIRPLEALKARIWIKQGKLTKTIDWIKDKGLSTDDELSYLREFEHLTLARMLIVKFQKDHDPSYIVQTLELLNRLLKAAEESERTGSVIEILIMLALAHQAQNNIPSAMASLERALTLAEPEGYVRTFVDEGLPMKHLLLTAKAKHIVPSYCDKLLAALE